MTAQVDYRTSGRIAGRYKAIGAPVWANDLDRAMARAIAQIDDGTAASKDAKAQILDDWADNIKTLAAAIHSGTPS
jgi:hypothetical protein